MVKKVNLSIVSILIVICIIFGTMFSSYATKYKGDVNNDDNVNSADALLILQYAVGLKKDISLTVGDVNNDGKINSADALLVLQIAVGLKQKSTILSSTTKSTTKTTTTTKATTTTVKYEYINNKYEIKTSGVKTYIGKVLRAWHLTGNGCDITVSRIQYGSKYSQTFNNKNIYGTNTKKYQIDNPKTLEITPYCNVAVIKTSDPTKFKISAGTKRNYTEECAKSLSAVIAVAAEDNYFEKEGAVIRNSKIFKSYTGTDKATKKRLITYRDGRTWEYKPLDNATANTLIKNGAYNSITIQRNKPIISGGKAQISENETFVRNQTYAGQIDKNTYVLVTTEFMKVLDVIKVMQAYGVKEAVQINGGNCTQMYVKGVGNTTGSKATQISPLNKIGVLETEFFGNNKLLGLNDKGQQKLGGPCTETYSIIYF